MANGTPSPRSAEPVYADPYARITWLHERVDALKLALVNLRETVDLYVSDDVGMPELADAMDKAYAALYPPKDVTS